jgi:hypothetical protein
VHVAGGEDVDEEADERDEARVDGAQAIHREAEVGAETPDLDPRPQVVEDDVRLLAPQRPVGAERQRERDGRRHRHRPARHGADKLLAPHAAPHQPVDDRPHQRREDDVANHKKVVSSQ